MLPVKDGYAVCRELRGSGIRTPIPDADRARCR